MAAQLKICGLMQPPQAAAVAGLGADAIGLTGTNEHSWCRPDAIIQAHAIWHLLTAGATWAFFRFFRTEAPVAVRAARVTAQAS